MNSPIPGPDPGACDRCGTWQKAGMVHDCEAENERLRRLLDSETDRHRAENERLRMSLHLAEGSIGDLKQTTSAKDRIIGSLQRRAGELEAENERLREILRNQVASADRWFGEAEHLRKAIQNSDRDHWYERSGELEAEVEWLRKECDLMHARTSDAVAGRNAAENEVERLRAAAQRADGVYEAAMMVRGDELEQALRELVALKDGPRDENYEHRKPLAWERARRLVLNPRPKDEG